MVDGVFRDRIEELRFLLIGPNRFVLLRPVREADVLDERRNILVRVARDVMALPGEVDDLPKGREDLVLPFGGVFDGRAFGGIPFIDPLEREGVGNAEAAELRDDVLLYHVVDAVNRLRLRLLAFVYLELTAKLVKGLCGGERVHFAPLRLDDGGEGFLRFLGGRKARFLNVDARPVYDLDLVDHELAIRRFADAGGFLSWHGFFSFNRFNYRGENHIMILPLLVAFQSIWAGSRVLRREGHFLLFR